MKNPSPSFSNSPSLLWKFKSDQPSPSAEPVCDHSRSHCRVKISMTYDAIIAGGGPVGLFLACELRLAGVSVLLFEKNENPSTPLKNGWMGARGLNFPSTEALYRRGLLPAVKRASFGWMDGGQRRGMQFTGDQKVPAPPVSA